MLCRVVGFEMAAGEVLLSAGWFEFGSVLVVRGCGWRGKGKFLILNSGTMRRTLVESGRDVYVFICSQ